MALQQQLDRPTRAGRRTHRTEYRGADRAKAFPSSDLSRGELLQLLNEDFARECQSVYAYAVYAERYCESDPVAAEACESLGHREVAHAMALGQLVHDFGGVLTASVDDRSAIRRADRVARPQWSAETVRRLGERAEQLRAAGRPHLATRLTQLIEQKRSADDLADVVRRHADPRG